MTTPDPTMSEATQHKKDLETTISNAMQRFGELTGLTVECVSVEVIDARMVQLDPSDEGATKIKITYQVEATVEL